MGAFNNNKHLVQRLRRALASAALGACGICFAGDNSRLDDLFLGVWSPFASKWETSVPVCVWSDTTDTLFKVTATGTQPGRRYYLTNDLGDRVSYNIFWHFGTKLKRREKLQSGVSSRGSFPFDKSRFCPNGPNANVRVRVNHKQIGAAIPAIYEDTILIVFSPL